MFSLSIRTSKQLQEKLEVSWFPEKLVVGEISSQYYKVCFESKLSISPMEKYFSWSSGILRLWKAQRLYEKCQTEISDYEELPNIMEYGKQPFKLWIYNK